MILVATKCDEFDDQDTLNSRCESDIGLPNNTSAEMGDNSQQEIKHQRKSKKIRKQTGEQAAQ